MIGRSRFTVHDSRGAVMRFGGLTTNYCIKAAVPAETPRDTLMALGNQRMDQAIL